MKYLFSIALSLCIVVLPALPNNELVIDSLESSLLQSNEDSNKVSIQFQLYSFYKRSNLDKALDNANESLQLSRKLNYKKGIAKSLGNIGSIKYKQGLFAEALSYYHQSIILKRELKDSVGVASCLNNIGIVNWYQGEYEKSIDYYLQALRIREQSDDKQGVASTLGNIGIVYKTQGLIDKALDYNMSALEILEKLVARHPENVKYKKIWATTMNTIGGLYKRLDDYETAEVFHRKALVVFEETENRRGIAACLVNIGSVFSENGDYEKALHYMLRSLQLKEELGNKRGIAISLNNIGEIYSYLGKFDLGINFMQRSLDISSVLGIRHLASATCANLATNYAKMNKYKPASKYLQQHLEYKDSLFNENKSREIGKLEAKFEFDKEESDRKQLEIKELRLKNEIKDRRDNLQYSGILIFIALLFMGVFMLGRFTIPIRLAEGIVFFSFLLVFEFTLVLLDPYIEQYSSGAPAIKLVFNASLAALMFPLHSFFERKLKGRITK
ncbi:MAG: hypothetical protein COB85_00525 [Bacteroidetes bacterium]|nr:MAG: hypothetical protein COB85_00525 [Bacteroidota bacterium]